MDEKQLDATVSHLIHRLDAARLEAAEKGSAEWQAAYEVIGKFIEKYPDDGFYAQKHNSNLGIDPL
jgi:hypothetical protein